jgi:hypothetical protein
MWRVVFPDRFRAEASASAGFRMSDPADGFALCAFTRLPQLSFVHILSITSRRLPL